MVRRINSFKIKFFYPLNILLIGLVVVSIYLYYQFEETKKTIQDISFSKNIQHTKILSQKIEKKLLSLIDEEGFKKVYNSTEIQKSINKSIEQMLTSTYKNILVLQKVDNSIVFRVLAHGNEDYDIETGNDFEPLSENWGKIYELKKPFYFKKGISGVIYTYHYPIIIDDTIISFVSIDFHVENHYLIQESFLQLEELVTKYFYFMVGTILIIFFLSYFNKRKTQEKNDLLKKLSKTKNELNILNKTLEEKVKSRTEELFNSKMKLQEQSYRDFLTNIYNRRYFHDIAQKMINLAKRNKTPICVVMVDIDHFKKINDTYGHNIGDEVIKQTASILQMGLRQSDIVARFGGEEFAILLPETSLENAFSIAKKLNININEMTLCLKDDLHITFTVSAGVEEIDLQNDTLVDEALDRADQALYDAKKSGRNRVCKFNNFM